ncbi:MAG TPA: hypothetical protein VIY28_02235 [Pseudonocardiaceae bacterium]
MELEPGSQQSICDPIEMVWDWLMDPNHISPNHNEILVGHEPSDICDTR